jgi:hypothetical protein
MRKYINDKPEFPQSYAEVSRHALIFEGHDVPRYIFPDNTEAGDLGISRWGDKYWYKPVFSSEISDATSSLSASKLYAIRVVPVKTNVSVGGLPVYGGPTMASIPKAPSSSGKALVFSIPAHPQMAIKDVGFSDLSASDYLSDSTRSWTENEYAGAILKNVDTGLYATIYRNTATRLYAYGVSFTSGDRYQILESAVTRRDIYVAEIDPSEVSNGVDTFDYYLIGSVDDNTTLEYTLNAYGEGADILTAEMLASFDGPPSANSCAVVSGVTICGGGVTEERGLAKYEGTVETVQASSAPDEDIKVEIVDDEYSGAGSGRIMRLTLGDSLTGFDKAVEGSRVTITGAENSENNVANAKVTRVHEYDLEATTPDGTSELQVGFFDNDAYVYFSGNSVGDNVTITAIGDFRKVPGVAQAIIGRRFWDNSPSPRRFTLQISSSGDLQLVTTSATATVLSANWTEGIQTIVVTKTGTSVSFSSNGASLTSSGSATATVSQSGFVTYVGAEPTLGLPQSPTSKFHGKLYEIKWQETASSNDFHFRFDAGSGSVIEDLINGYDGTLSATSESNFWSQTLPFNLNAGDGTASDPSLTDISREDLWTLTCTASAIEVFTATTPVVTGTGDGAVSAPTGEASAVAEDWTLTCTADGPSATFSVVGSVSGAQAGLTSEIEYTNDYFTITVADGTAAWLIGDTITFTVSMPVQNAAFSVVGNIAGAQADLISGVEYTNDYFTITVSDGASPWTEGDFLVFNVIKSAVADKRWIEVENDLAATGGDFETTPPVRSRYPMESETFSVVECSGASWVLTSVVTGISGFRYIGEIVMPASDKALFWSSAGLDVRMVTLKPSGIVAYNGTKASECNYSGGWSDVYVGFPLGDFPTISINGEQQSVSTSSPGLLLPSLTKIIVDSGSVKYVLLETTQGTYEYKMSEASVVHNSGTARDESLLRESSSSSVSSGTYTINVGGGEISQIDYANIITKAETWTMICTADGPSATFSVVGSESGSQADMTSGAEYDNGIFTITVGDGSPAWSVGDMIRFSSYEVVGSYVDSSMKIELVPNYIQGTLSGGSATGFDRGLQYAGFQFPSDGMSPYEIEWVDPVNQRLGLPVLYTGNNTGFDAIKIQSDWTAAYSDAYNPHRFRPENTIETGDSVTGISSVGDTILIFCQNSLWRIDIDSLGGTPVMITNNVRCPAQFSIVKGERYVMFYDGSGFSITDGVTVQSVTAYRARDYLSNINKAYERNIRGVYDRENMRFEFSLPLGNEELNNYGLYITDGSWSCYPFSRPDCNALWTNFDDGNLKVYHGTSGALVSSGVGSIVSHEGETDGTPDSGEYLFTITSISGQTFSVSADGNASLAEGDVITVYPNETGGSYRQMIVDSATKTSTDPASATYNITVSDAYDISAYGAGDTIAFGLIPFDYGIKWTDFSSPQYRHQVRALHIDLEGAYGLIFVDHYLDMNEAVVATNGYSVYPNNTKLIIPFRGGKCYKYGFRLRGLSLKQVKISAFEIMFDTQV